MIAEHQCFSIKTFKSFVAIINKLLIVILKAKYIEEFVERRIEK